MDIKEFFGKEASQDASFLYIKKDNLMKLTPSLNNKAEQLLAAIIATAQNQFEGLIIDENNNLIVDETGSTIGYSNSEFYNLTVIFWRAIPLNRNNLSFIAHQYLIEQYAETD